MPDRSSTARSDAWLALVFVTALLPFLALVPFALPANDDFVYAVTAQEHGLIDVQRLWYQQWCGRFFATAVQTGFPLACDMRSAYALVPVAALGLLFFAVGGLVWSGNRALGRPLTVRTTAVAALALAAIYVSQMPLLSEGFYWLAGVATYTLPLLTGIATLGCALAIGRTSSRTAVAVAAVSAAILGLLTAGGNETILPPLGLLLLAGGAVSIRRKHPSRWVWLAALAGFSLGALLLVLAPGNAHRGAHFADKPGPLRLAFELLWASVRLPAKWSIRPMLLGATVLAVPVLSAALRPSAWARRITGWHVLLSAAASWFLVLGSLAPGYVSLGFGPPGRAVNVSYFIFLAGWFVTAGLAVAWRENVAAARHPAMVGPTVPMLSPRVRVCGWALLLGGLLAVGNFPWAVYDLAFVVGDYDRRLESRYAELDAAAARGQSSATVVPLTTRPRRTICQGDVGDDPSQTPFIARYFGLASLTVAGAEPQRR